METMFSGTNLVLSVEPCFCPIVCLGGSGRAGGRFNRLVRQWTLRGLAAKRELQRTLRGPERPWESVCLSVALECKFLSPAPGSLPALSVCPPTAVTLFMTVWLSVLSSCCLSLSRLGSDRVFLTPLFFLSVVGWLLLMSLWGFPCGSSSSSSCVPCSLSAVSSSFSWIIDMLVVTASGSVWCSLSVQ